MTFRKEVIGDATLYNGDCVSVMEQIEADSVDLIWTDPPYGNENNAKDANATLRIKRGLENGAIINDDLVSMKTVVAGMLKQGARLIKKDCGTIAACCAGGGNTGSDSFAWLSNTMNEPPLTFYHAVVWDKVNIGIGWRWRRQYEFIMECHRLGGDIGWYSNNNNNRNIITWMPSRDREHPNEKPYELINVFIEVHTLPGHVIMDPFMGSGSTGVAALKAGRKFIGIELDPKHFVTACRRIEESSKQPGLFIV